MLLLDIEEHIKPLSTSDKEQLIRDVQRMLDTQKPPVIEGHKLQDDWDFHDAAEVAANLQAYKATLKGPTRLDPEKLVYLDE